MTEWKKEKYVLKCTTSYISGPVTWLDIDESSLPTLEVLHTACIQIKFSKLEKIFSRCALIFEGTNDQIRMFCETCAAMFCNTKPFPLRPEGQRGLLEPRSFGEEKHHTTFAQLEEAAHSRCYICNTLYNTFISHNGVDPTDLRLRFRFRLIPFNEAYSAPSWWYLEFYFFRGEDHLDWDRVLFQLFPLKDPSPGCLQWYNSEENIPASTEDLRVHERAKKWLETCQSTHKNCQRLVEEIWWPPRLLDLRNGKVRLMETDKEEPSGPYATLSHCWGINPTFFTLTADNINNLYSEISVPDLPKTFQDTILVVRNLNIDFLWIDSLCIIQSGTGAREDWQKQAGLMSSIYTNCVVNIAAAGSGSSEGRLFSIRDPELIRHPIINWVPGETHQVQSKLDHEEVTGSRLATRGWVFQERLLAPRTLHFGSRQLSWKCCEVAWDYEARLLVANKRIKRNTLADEEDSVFDFRLPRVFSPTKTTKFGSTSWRNIVKKYSEKTLTNAVDDKLVALGGVARHLAAICKDDYAAGLFKSGLPQDLLWDTGFHSLPRTAEYFTGGYRAPSWSWASVEGKISFHSYLPSEQELLTAVSSVNVTLVDKSNPYGQVSSAELLLHGPMAKCMQWEEEMLWEEDRCEGLDKKLPVLCGLDSSLASHMHGCSFSVRYDAVNPNMESYSDIGFLSILFQDHQRSTKIAPRQGGTIIGLVLGKIGMEEHWMRIGCFQISYFTDEEPDVMKLLRTGKKSYVTII